MKKLIFAMALLLGLLLGGCGTEQKKEQPEEEQKQATLTFMMPQSHAKDFLLELVDEFEKENEDIHLEIQRIPDDQWIDLVHSKAAVGEMPDLIRLDKWVLESVGVEHFVEFPKETSWYSRILEDQLENKLIDGKLYGLPIAGMTGVGLIYNQDIFAELSLEVPDNLEDLKNVCERLKEAGYIPLYASDKEAWTIQIPFNCMIAQCTEEETWEKLKNQEIRFCDVPEYQEILNEMLYFRREHDTNEDYMEATYEGAVEAMAEGRTAMYVSGQFFINDVLAENPDIRLMMSAFPYDGSDCLSVISGAGLFAVNRDSRHIEEAKRFLEWFSRPEHMDRFNAGWSHFPVFKEQELPMNEIQSQLYKKYIVPEKTVVQIDETLSGINLNGLWNYLKEMIAGRMKPEEVIKKWDRDFDEQMRYLQKK